MKYTALLLDLMKNDAPESIDLILKFLVTFSKLENALFEVKLYDRNSKIPRADWTGFTTCISSKFSSEEVADAFNYILYENPPRRLRNNDGQLEWEERTFENEESELEKVIFYVLDIRNNLFHGGKFNGAYEANFSRNHILLTYALELLNYWIGLDNRIASKYRQGFY